MTNKPKSNTRLLDVQSAKKATIKKRAPAMTSDTLMSCFQSLIPLQG